MRLNWGSHPLALFVVMAASALAAAALGTTLGTFVKTEGQASGLSLMAGMIMALLGGCWYPLEMCITSFIERVYNLLPRLPQPIMLAAASFGHGLMEVRQLRGIKRRAEA